MNKFSTISERRKETALLQAEASACALGLANVLFVGWVFLQTACIQRLRIWPVAHFRENTYTPTLLWNTYISKPTIRAIGYMRC